MALVEGHVVVSQRIGDPFILAVKIGRTGFFLFVVEKLDRGVRIVAHAEQTVARQITIRHLNRSASDVFGKLGRKLRHMLVPVCIVADAEKSIGASE